MESASNLDEVKEFVKSNIVVMSPPQEYFGRAHYISKRAKIKTCRYTQYIQYILPCTFSPVLFNVELSDGW